MNTGKRIAHAFYTKFLGAELDLRVRLFNLLALVGTLISLVMAALSLVNDSNIWSFMLNSVLAVLSFILLYYSYRSGNYQRCYIITIVAIFLLFFPVLFFVSGGYHSGMPSFFVFAVLFTVFMLEGKRAYLLTACELVVYVVICVYAYRHPESVVLFESEEAFFLDVLIGFLTVCVALGLTMILHFRIYNTQQKQLEEAREEAIYHNAAKSVFLASMSHEIRTPIRQR